jgi:hypothetical protein
MINHPKQGYLTHENHNLRTLYDSRSHIAWNDSHIVGKFRDICMKSLAHSHVVAHSAHR